MRKIFYVLHDPEQLLRSARFTTRYIRLVVQLLSTRRVNGVKRGIWLSRMYVRNGL